MDVDVRSVFSSFSNRVAAAAGHWASFAAAAAIVLGWAASGPFFDFSDTWQLAINTGTTVVTFLMVFLIQHTQNHDTRAIHLKLDELIRTKQDANNALIAIEQRKELSDV